MDELDTVLGADPSAGTRRALGHFEPRLPSAAAEAAFDALVERYKLRWAEYWGPVGERVRVLEAEGVICVEGGVILDARSHEPVTSLPEAGDAEM